MPSTFGPAQVLVIIRRANWLARTVSSAELYFSHFTGPKSKVGTSERANAMYTYFRRFDRKSEYSQKWVQTLGQRSGWNVDKGENAGMALGYRIVDLQYSKTDWPCRQAKIVAVAAADMGALKAVPKASCPVSHQMGQVSHRELTLEERVGPKAAKLIEGNMKGTPYEWMLDLSSESPPKGSSGPKEQI